MFPAAQPADGAPRLGDRLAAARRGRFVGREAERELFRSALLAEEPPFAVLHLYGPGGVGKTSLLREYARIAAECGRPVAYLDGRGVEPSPPALLLALRRALGQEDADGALSAPDWPTQGVLLVDTYETLAPLDAWLREVFLPALPARSLVVLAGRNPPEPAWRTDLDWAALTRVAVLRNLLPEEGRTYLAARGIPAEHHAQALAFTHGHPLALALVADVLDQSGVGAAFDPRSEPDVVRVLLERFVRHVPTPQHRLALEACAHARVTTEEVLVAALEADDVHDLFGWLRGLSFVEQGPDGLFPHDLVRDMLDADLRWRDPTGYRELHRRVRLPMVRRLHEARGRDRQRAAFDILYLHRTNPIMAGANDWASLGNAYAEPAAAADLPALLAMIRRHEGDASTRIAEHWWARQPQAFAAVRAGGGDLVGFTAVLDLAQAAPEDLEVDPAAETASAFVRSHGPTRAGEAVIHHRFWMGLDTYQAVSPAQNLMAAGCLLHWVTTPRLAWSFLPVADPSYWDPIFTYLRLQRSPDAEFVVGDRHYAVYTHDWRAEPAPVWLELMGEREIADDPMAEQPEPSPPPLSADLSELEFAEAVRQALRDYARPDRLAANSLLRSRLVAGAANGGRVTALRAVIRDAVAALAADPRDAKLHRALWHTYLEPAPTQERAAELLGLPFNTYRYHLAKGIERVAEGLWRRELGVADG